MYHKVKHAKNTAKNLIFSKKKNSKKKYFFTRYHKNKIWTYLKYVTYDKEDTTTQGHLIFYIEN